MTRRTFGRAAVVCGALALVFATPQVWAQNLLVNGGLDLPGLHEQDLVTGWTLTEGPGAVNAATMATFANHTPPPIPPGSTAQVGLWYRAFEGTTFDNPRPAVDADLAQSVPGIPGVTYTMTGWARFETNYAGGLDTLAGRWPAGTPSPTRTEFALEFLDVANAVLPGSVIVDLHDDRGQANDGLWHEHSLTGTAPLGTVAVRVRASMLDGVNSDQNPQSAFVDDFTLVPEPTGLAVLALAGAGLLARRRRA